LQLLFIAKTYLSREKMSKMAGRIRTLRGNFNYWSQKMMGKLRLFFVGVWLFVGLSFAHASINPISVFPDPIQFGTIAENQTYALAVYVTNSTADSVTITDMTISGGNKSAFAFSGQTCVGVLAGEQTCQMAIAFTPTTMAGYTANFVIDVLGVSQKTIVPLEGTGGNPLPTITSISPQTAYLNSPSFTLTVNGTGFVSGAAVYISSSALPTTYVSSTQLTATVSAAYLSNTGSDYLYVVNPGPGGGYSGSAILTVVSLDPYLSSVSPSSVVAGTSPTPIVVSGSSFMSGATVQWNGKPLPTTYINSGQLQITPTAAELGGASIAQLSVSNPSPGGVSSAVEFNVTYPAKITVLDLPANDLIWDPYAQQIYASLPSSYGSKGNSIAVIDPLSGKVRGYYFVGSEPNQLALSSDSSYLYVGLNGNGSVERLRLPGFTPDINISLGSSEYGGLNTALNLQVYPTDPHSFAVAEGSEECCGNSGLYFYTNKTQLSNSVTNSAINDIVFADSATLYGFDQGTLSQVAVNSSGGTVSNQWDGLVEGDTIAYAAGLIYGSNGQVLNPKNSNLVGTYDVTSECCDYSSAILPDSAINRTFVLAQTSFSVSFGITSYNLSEFTPEAVANLSQLNSSAAESFISWGGNGLAFILLPSCCQSSAPQVVLVQSPAMFRAAGSTDGAPPVAQSLSPGGATHAGTNFPLIVRGAGFVSGSQVSWNGTTLATDYISPTQLKAYVPATAIASSDTAQVVVTNPSPSGGSSALTFTIN
jgi:trimeric autotransporter adhesin